MSYILYDLLSPFIGSGAAQHWSQIFVVGPRD
jgi:hypothetical protein